MHRPEADRDPVPGVDRRDEKRELHQLGLAELRTDLVVDGVGDVRLRYQRYSLGPGQHRPLALRIERRLPPGIQEVEPFLGLAVGAGVARMHVDAEGAAIDLRVNSRAIVALTQFWWCRGYEAPMTRA